MTRLNWLRPFVFTRLGAAVALLAVGISEDATAAGLKFAGDVPVGEAQLLSLPLRDDQTVDDVIVAPDGSSVVYTLVDWERIPPDGLRLTNRHVYSASTADLTSTQIDPPSLNLSAAGIGSPPTLLVSSDSRHVYFKGLTESGGSGIYRGALDGSDTTLLVDLPHLPRGARQIFLAPDDQWLIYQEENFGDFYSVPTAGGPAIKLNDVLGPDEYFVQVFQSPVASRVLLSSGKSGDRGETLWSANPDGSDFVAIAGPGSSPPTLGVRSNSIRSTPGTDYVAFSGIEDPPDYDPFDNPIYVARAVGGPAWPLDVPAGSVSNVNATVTPDGRRVVYHSYWDRDEPFDLYWTSIDRGGVVRINDPLAPGERLGLFPRFGEDGSTIYYDVQGVSAGLYRASLNGSDVLKLNAPVAPGGGFIRAYTLSPDESVIAYSEDDDGDGVHDLFVTRTDGSSSPVQVNLPLPSFGAVSAISFSDDGRWLIYHADAYEDDVPQPFLTSIDLDADGFGLLSGSPAPIGVDGTRSTFASFLPGNQVLLRVGDFVVRQDLYLLRIPEPTAGLLTLLGLLGSVRSRVG